jgi:hypothetical protein
LGAKLGDRLLSTGLAALPLQQYSCWQVRGVLKGVERARLVTQYSDKGGRTYKVVIDHMNGSHPLTMASDNVYVDSKVKLVDAINARLTSVPIAASSIVALASGGGAVGVPKQHVMSPPPPTAVTAPLHLSSPPIDAIHCIQPASWFQSALTDILNGIHTAQDSTTLLQALEVW